MIATYTIARLVTTLFDFYSMLVLIYCIMSWIPMRAGGMVEDFAAVLNRIVGPYLNLFRRVIPPFGGIDFSPVIAIIALNLIERLLLNILL